MTARWVASGALALCAIGAALWLLAPDKAISGEQLFTKRFAPSDGLGPLFNERSCSGCHLEPSIGGVGRRGLATATRVGRLTAAGFDPIVRRGGLFAHAHAVSELGVACDRAAGIPAGANVTSVRNTPPLFGAGLIDAISDDEIRAAARVPRGDAVSGRPNLVRGPDGRVRVGRFGWKADTPTLARFVADAFRNELGVTSSDAPGTPRAGPHCVGDSPSAEIAGDALAAVTRFVASLKPPRPPEPDPAGAALFEQTGCAACHRPSLRAGGRVVPLYSDLLIHDMGPALDDRVVQGAAGGSEWRTAPLWGLRDRPRLLHDGRAHTLEAAILAHGGEAQTSRRRFVALADEQRRRLVAFLRSL